MNQKNRMLAGLPYTWLDGLSGERVENKLKIYEYNLLRPNETEKMNKLIKDILGKTDNNVFIEQPFHCDYGKNIEVGNNFFANYNCTILDVGKVTIGNNVWLGGNVVVNPGVNIGNNVVVGSGSVVTKDIPDNVIAVGNPCKVIREITEEDRKYYYKNYEFDVDDYTLT
ncbi:galactoside O-acetyltransferase [Clostridium gelidum]|uniref:Acetyltransferase n=1 Tax=Clostridium gelidum TaxID=704125 RepID=A0ABM7T9R6_9CLOT|nr:maltose acetyltransferase domain-containing protein [Clostridium gelidum]BCZ48718.1 galactoside O-acetyltransferase [Clostridium gelidum]